MNAFNFCKTTNAILDYNNTSFTFNALNNVNPVVCCYYLDPHNLDINNLKTCSRFRFYTQTRLAEDAFSEYKSAAEHDLTYLGAVKMILMEQVGSMSRSY